MQVVFKVKTRVSSQKGASETKQVADAILEITKALAESLEHDLELVLEQVDFTK